ncbi:DUF3558 domain-containing protein [Amycolatopsis sp. FU40]|uniref:DUF3558 domain-containing protein n=1 Tax=Amycolatopsis sp. FU40 TaxID=2914159 RepID=UPI001F22AA4A|nr:DUF3558 domain-containing protein [Amycolatopsis sp. FU40]UKD53779.1 DUF3558 domain-containing protein [Amycolatopsis sp. FU40]
MKQRVLTAGTYTLLAISLLALTGCSSSTGSPTKKMGSQKPCELISTQDLGAILQTSVPKPEMSGPQCQYSTANTVTVSMSRGVQSAKGGSEVAVEGQRATKSEFAKGQGCVMDVQLADDDPQQLFSVAMVFGPDAVAKFGDKACELTEKVVAKVIQSLPG